MGNRPDVGANANANFDSIAAVGCCLLLASGFLLLASFKVKTESRPVCSTQPRRIVRRKDASWSLNWPSGANLLARKQHMYFFLLPL